MNENQKTILVVENDTVLSGMLMNALTLAGFHVVQAWNGIEGLDAVRAHKPDLMLLDIDMPEMNGITMLKKLHEEGNRTHAIILTNMNTPEQVANATEEGAYEYLIKADWELDQIVEQIKLKLKV